MSMKQISARRQGKCLLIISLVLLFFCSCQTSQHSKDTYFRATKTSIQKGETISLRWNYNKYKDIKISGIGEGLETSGTISVSPDSTTLYTLEAWKSKNENVTRKLTIVVNEAVFSMIDVSDSTDDEHPIKIKWKTLNAAKVKLEGDTTLYPASGGAMIRLDSSSNFTLTAINAFGKETTKTIRIDVGIIESLTAGPKAIIQDDSTWLRWKYKNTASVSIEGFNRQFNTCDSVKVAPQLTTIYKLTANRKYRAKSIDTISIKVYPQGIALFKGTPTIILGSTCVLRWQTRKANRITLQGGGIDVDLNKEGGSVVVKPIESTTYTLTAYCNKITDTREFKVNVIQRNYVDSVMSINKLKSGQRMDFEIFEVDRSNYPNEIKLKVLVVDTSGNFITGLAPKATSTAAESNKYFKKIIEVAEGKSTPVKNFSVREVRNTTDEPADISLVTDYSGSMSENIGILVKSLRKYISHKDVLNRLSLVVFDDSIATMIGLEKDANRLLQTLADVSYSDFGSSTSLYAAADKGMRTLKNSVNHKMMLLFTDGYENSSFMHSDSLYYTPQEVVAEARKNNIHINSIVFGDDANIPLLEYLSMLADGNIYRVQRPNDINKVYGEISIISKNYYEITYKPIAKEGERVVLLNCYNNVENITARRKTFIGENYLISEFRFSDGRYKYIDSLIQLLNIQAAMQSPPRKYSAVTVPQAIAFFDFGKYDLRTNDQANVDKYVEWMPKYPDSKVLLLGHTDLKGNDKSCVALSQQRADAIKDYLIQKGISKDRIITIACGKRNPVNSVESDDAKAQENRRVEAVLVN